jgi:uncharacterized protein (DUF302 family)
MRHLALMLSLVLFAGSTCAENWMVRKKVAASFDDTREAVTIAIENRGLVVNYVSHLGEMLERTGADIGATRRIFGQAQIIEFCSARLSRQMMELDPHNIVLCPFAISIYTLPGEPGTWVSYRRPTGTASQMVEPLLKAIADEAAP